ncbi:MAG: hypothetical protein ACI9N1_002754, partial [Flavobacteriales bacterium]
ESISNSWIFLLTFVIIHSIIIQKSSSQQELKQSLLLAMGLNLWPNGIICSEYHFFVYL